MWNRDSWIWWVGIVGAVLLGLVTLDNPVDYGIPASWVPYLRGLALVVGIISGKLATSPLPGAKFLLAGLLALTLPLSACAGRSAPVVVGETGLRLAQSIGEIQRAVSGLQQAGAITVQQAITAQETLLKANDEVAKVPPILRALDAGTATPASIPAAIQSLESVVTTLSALGVGWADHPAIPRVIALIRATHQLVLTTAVELGRVQGARSAQGGTR